MELVHVPGDAELPCCAAAMLTNTHPAKSRTRLPLLNMLRRPVLHVLHSLPRLRVQLWTLTKRDEDTSEDGVCQRLSMHRDGSDGNGSGSGKLHASARKAAPALLHASVAPTLHLVQPPLLLVLAEWGVLQLGTQQQSGRDASS